MDDSIEKDKKNDAFTSVFNQLMQFYGLFMPPQCSTNVTGTQHNVNYRTRPMETPTRDK